MNYQEQLQHPKWQKKRLEILRRDNFTCQKCGDKETMLHIHHKKYENGLLVWEYPDEEYITFCKECHEIISILLQELTNFRLDVELIKVKISQTDESNENIKSIILFRNPQNKDRVFLVIKTLGCFVFQLSELDKMKSWLND